MQKYTISGTDIFRHIRNERKKQGLTQAELAERAGISLRTIVMVEQLHNGVSVRRLERILNALHCGLTVVHESERHRPVEEDLAAFFREDREDQEKCMPFSPKY